MDHASVQVVARIERHAYEFGWTAGNFHDCIRAGYDCWLWRAEGTIVGYGVLSSGAGEAHVLNLCVDQAWQGLGQGRRQLAYLLHCARARGARSVFLEVRLSNHIGRALYVSEGFVEIGQRPGYYPSHRGREDALVMKKILSQEAVGAAR